MMKKWLTALNTMLIMIGIPTEPVYADLIIPGSPYYEELRGRFFAAVLLSILFTAVIIKIIKRLRK